MLIIGHGSGQVARIVTAFTAATDADWQWLPIGIDLGDVSTLIASHNASTVAHSDIRALAPAAVTAHNAAADAHADIRALVAALSAASGLVIAAYSATSTYSRGGSNSFVTHANGLFLYIDSASRNANHDPGQHPGYWYKLSAGVAYEVIASGAHRIAARTVIVNADTDAVYICAQTQTTPRDLAYIEAQSQSLGGAFIRLNRPADLTGLPVVREYNTATRSVLRAKGDIDEYQGHWYVSTISHTPGIASDAVPGQNDDFRQIDRSIVGLTQAAYDAITFKDATTLYVVTG